MAAAVIAAAADVYFHLHRSDGLEMCVCVFNTKNVRPISIYLTLLNTSDTRSLALPVNLSIASSAAKMQSINLMN